MSKEEMDSTDKKPSRSALALIGCRLNTVQFVLDYVQLFFDGPRHPRLTAVTCPKVQMGNTLFEWGSPGYRDALCGCIERIVSTVSVIDKEEFRITFEDGTLITISLKPEDYTAAAEAVIIDTGPPEHILGVW
jgi:hypothetical protein